MSPSSTTNDQGKGKKNIFSRMFGNKLNPTPDYPAADQTTPTDKQATLVQEQPREPTKSMAMSQQEQDSCSAHMANTTPPEEPRLSQEESESLNDLMAKAGTMPPAQFKAYLTHQKEEADAVHRKQSVDRKWGYSKEFLSNEAL
jgi:hypothetical protein